MNKKGTVREDHFGSRQHLSETHHKPQLNSHVREHTWIYRRNLCKWTITETRSGSTHKLLLWVSPKISWRCSIIVELFSNTHYCGNETLKKMARLLIAIGLLWKNEKSCSLKRFLNFWVFNFWVALLDASESLAAKRVGKETRLLTQTFTVTHHWDNSGKRIWDETLT